MKTTTFGPIAIHKADTRDHWVLTHRGSGFTVALVLGPGWAAQTLAREFRDADVSWDDQDEFFEHWPATEEALTAAWKRAVAKIEERGTHKATAEEDVPYAVTLVQPRRR